MAKLGTPENPEIIEPSANPPPHSSPSASRGVMAWQILKIIVGVTLPAAGIGMIYAWIFHTAVHYGGLLLWAVIVVLTLPTLILTFVAVVANLVLWPALFLILAGRSLPHPLRQSRFVRFQF